MTENDARRNARLLALMAANAFILFQVYMHHAEFVAQGKADKHTAVTTFVIALLTLAGMAASYFALLLKPKHKAAFSTEIVAMLPVGFMAFMYVINLFQALFLQPK